MKMKGISDALLAIAFALVGPATILAESPSDGVLAPIIYAPDFVSAVAYGVAMNDAGDIVGTSFTNPGCGPFCLPPLETVVWKAGVRIVLPSVPGFTGTAVTDINNKGWISGSAGVFGFTDAVVWKPNGNTYTAIDLGVLPGTAHSVAVGIDDTNRVVGYATALSGFQTPFMWTEAGGMLDQAGVPKRDPARDQFRRDCGHVRPLVSPGRPRERDRHGPGPLGGLVRGELRGCDQRRWRPGPWLGYRYRASLHLRVPVPPRRCRDMAAD